MNRNEEYRALLQELETTPPALDTAVERAMERRRAARKRRLWGIPVGSLAACFLLFVGLVNAFPTFAAACEDVPVLGALAEAVRFSPSLSAAVEHDYVQPVGQSQTKNGITATVESVKAASDLFSPVSGTVTAVNEELADHPDLVNQAPYEGGWMVRVALSGRPSGLLNAADYEKLCQE